MTLRLNVCSGGVVELHVHDGAHLIFSEPLDILAAERLPGPRPLDKPQQPIAGSKPSRWLLPMVAGLVGVGAGFALSAKPTVPGIAPPSVASLRIAPSSASLEAMPVARPVAVQPQYVEPYAPGRMPVPALQRSVEDGLVALPPAIAQQLAQPAQVTPTPPPSAAPLKRNGNAFGLED